MQEYFGVSFPKNWHPLICHLFLFRFGNTLRDDPMWRPDGWPDKKPQPYTGEGRFQHAKTIAERLLDKDFDWHHWSESAVETFCNELWIGISGCGSSGKSTAAALYANLFYLSAPGKSGVIILSTTIDAAKRRIWREVIRLHSALIKACGSNVFGSSTINSPRPSIRCDAKDTVHAICVVAVGKGQEEEGISILKGFHPKRLLIICDELDSIQQSVVDVCRINLQTGTEEFQFIGLGNPTSRFDPHGKLCEPEQGWDFLDNECEEWKSKSGAKVLRFDGYKSPRIQDGDNSWHGLIRQSDIDNITRLYGADSKYVWTMVRGLWAPDGTDNSIIPESLFIKFHARDKVTWRDSFARCSATDPAFGGDRCVWRRFDYGFDTSGKIKVFFHPPTIIPIHQNDASNPAEYQIAAAIRRMNDTNEIAPANTILDSTGTGRGVASVLQREYSPNILLCEFGGSASSLPVSDTNKKPSNQEYDRKISELLFSFSEFVKADMVRGLDDDTCIEFATRTFELKGSGQGKRFSVETKADFKARGNRSPDLMDCSAMAVDLLRRRHIAPTFSDSAVKLKHDSWEQLVRHFDLDSPKRTYQEVF